MSLQFGTDGVRGDTRDVLTAEAVSALGQAGAEILGASGFAVGRDTRASGARLLEAICGGVAAAGGSCVDLGVVPTPTVARWCAEHQVAGAVVSASHNPWFDNGVKFFGVGGLKLSDDVQKEIQQRFNLHLQSVEAQHPEVRQTEDRQLEVHQTEERQLEDRQLEDRQAQVHQLEDRQTKVHQLEDRQLEDGQTATHSGDKHQQAIDLHREAIVASVEGVSFAGIKLVVDLANGAATALAKQTLHQLGAAATFIHDQPDGHNINHECGSTNLASVQEAVVARGVDLGLAFDGDADRVLAVDAAGKVVDGDEIIAICVLDRKQRGRLAKETVVVTAMSNLGFRIAMEAAGIEIVETQVGDRFVLEAMETHGLTLGGEQSGHVMFRDLATTGDGLLTAAQLIDVMVRQQKSLGELAASAMTRLPQVLSNLEVERPLSPAEADELRQYCAPLIAAAQARMAGKGRILIRPSGTEALVRVMVEAETLAEAQMEADALAAHLKTVYD